MGNTERSTADILAEMAKNGAAIGPACGRMCKDCAFNPNQPHTPTFLSAAEDALNCLMWEGTFNCHTDNHQDAGQPCAGFLYAKQYLKELYGNGRPD